MSDEHSALGVSGGLDQLQVNISAPTIVGSGSDDLTVREPRECSLRPPHHYVWPHSLAFMQDSSDGCSSRCSPELNLHPGLNLCRLPCNRGSDQRRARVVSD